MSTTATSTTATYNTDPNVKIPAAVLANAQKAEELMKRATGEVTEPGNEPPATPETTPPATPEATPPAEAPAPAAEATPPAPAPAPTEPKTEDWEQKFRSEQGRAKRLREDLDRAHADLAAVEAENKSLREQLTAAPAAGTSLITPEELSEYGEDFMSVVGKKAEEIAAPLRKQLADLQAQMQGIGVKETVSAHQRMLNSLDEANPKWREINSNQQFIDWLAATTEELSGQSFKSLLDSAVQRHDAARVGRIISRFQQEHPAFAPTTPQPVADPLAQLAAPGRASPATPPNPGQAADKPFIKASDISAFYSDVTRNVFRGRDEEKKRLERMYEEAVRDGRVIP